MPKDHFAIDTELKGKELDEAYAEQLQDVERVQQSQLRILAGVKQVFGEGLTDENYPIFKAEIRSLRPFHRELADLGPATGLYRHTFSTLKVAKHLSESKG